MLKMPSVADKYKVQSILTLDEDDFVSFAALHTSVRDKKKLARAPRPSYTYWEPDPPSRAPVSAATSRNKDEDLVRGFNSRLNKLTTDLSTPSSFDNKLRRKLKKSRIERTQAIPAKQPPELTRWKSLSSIETGTRFSKLEDVDESSKRLGSRVGELKDLLTLTSNKVVPQPESMTSSKVVHTSPVHVYVGSNTEDRVVEDLRELEPDPGVLYTSSFTMNVSPPINEEKFTAENSKVNTSKSADMKLSDRNISRKQDKPIRPSSDNYNLSSRWNKEIENDGSVQESSLMHRILEKLKTQDIDNHAVNKHHNRYNDGGSRAELAEFAARLDSLSLPRHVERGGGGGENFWIKLGRQRGERAQLEQLVNHTFDPNHRSLYEHLTYPGNEYRTPELELFPQASLARRWTEDRLKKA